MNIAWSGLADSAYYHYIAKYCLPSWKRLPGDKFIIHDGNDIKNKLFTVIQWENIFNRYNTFTKTCRRTKPINFWRKMQSQVWALKTLRQYDYVVLLDTDIEIYKFNIEKFKQILDLLQTTQYIWATGESQLKKLDAGHIVVNMKHPSLSTLIFDYENIWESGKIFDFRRQYDGDAVEFLLDKYPSVKIQNIDHGGGLHVYDIGTVHYGSKIPKLLRAINSNFNGNIVEEILTEKNKISNDEEAIIELEYRINARNPT